MSDPARDASKTFVTRFASRLRFPQLFLLAAGLFLLDLIVPDLIPFVDEILLGLVTLLLGNLKNPSEDSAKPPLKDITPES